MIIVSGNGDERLLQWMREASDRLKAEAENWPDVEEEEDKEGFCHD